MATPFLGSLAPSPRRGGVPQLPRLIDKPSTAVAGTSLEAITFRNVVGSPSSPGGQLRLHRMGTPIGPRPNGEGALNHLLSIGVRRH